MNKKNRKIVFFIFFAAVIVALGLPLEIGAQMMDAVPAVEEKRVSAAKGATDKLPPSVVSKEPETTTAKDYSYYLKSGHKSSKWNEFIEPAFQTFDSGNLATASIFMQRAYDQGCRDPLLLFRYGIFLESKGNYAGAADMLVETTKNIAKHYPEHPLVKSIHKHAGRTLYHANRYEDALKSLAEVLKVQKDDFMALFMSGQILSRMGELQKARLILEMAAQTRPPAGMEADTIRPLLHELVTVTVKMGDVAASEAYLSQLLALYPDDPVGHQHKRELEKQRAKSREREILKGIID
jgi:tetratricopeptide (TPR) repeat protein